MCAMESDKTNVTKEYRKASGRTPERRRLQGRARQRAVSRKRNDEDVADISRIAIDRVTERQRRHDNTCVF